MRTITMYLTAVAVLVSLASCATTAERLTEVDLGSSKAEVRTVLGSPEGLLLLFVDDTGRKHEVLSYRLYQYRGAIDGLSPYYNIYALFFQDDELVVVQQIEENARLTEETALNIVLGLPGDESTD